MIVGTYPWNTVQYNNIPNEKESAAAPPIHPPVDVSWWCVGGVGNRSQLPRVIGYQNKNL